MSIPNGLLHLYFDVPGICNCSRPDLEVCPANEDGHCGCWYDGEPCCRCQDPVCPAINQFTGEHA